MPALELTRIARAHHVHDCLRSQSVCCMYALTLRACESSHLAVCSDDDRPVSRAGSADRVAARLQRALFCVCHRPMLCPRPCPCPCALHVRIGIHAKFSASPSLPEGSVNGIRHIVVAQLLGWAWCLLCVVSHLLFERTHVSSDNGHCSQK